MGFSPRDMDYMQRALTLAKRAQALDEVPVGAVLVKSGEIVGEGWNRPVSSSDPTSHAEIVALRDAAQRLENYRLPDTCLYVTIEPCTMCVGAIIHARVKRVVFGAAEPRAGAVKSQLQLLEGDHFNHRVEWVGGVLAEPCGELIRDFFRARRNG